MIVIMKKLLLLSLIFIFASTSLFSQTATLPAGDGSAGNPYQISSLDNLYWIAESDARWASQYIQTADINASATSTFDGGAGWTPIGNNNVKFLGNYDGQGYTMDGLYINRPNTNNVGLFGHVGYAGHGVTIKNLSLTNITVKGGRGSGTLVGRVTGDKTNLIENCSAVGGTVVGDGATGGLVGSHNSYVDNPSNRDHHPVISQCFADIDVSWSRKPGSGADKFGGLTGCNQKGQIQHCFARGSVTVNNDPEVTTSPKPERIGGLSGCILIRGYVINSYSIGQVTISGNVDNAGGFVGSGGTGGSDGDTENSFWDTQTSGQNTSSPTSGSTGKTTSEMKIQSTFTDWDFANMWAIYKGNNDGFPSLQWQIFQWVGAGDTSWDSEVNWKSGKTPGVIAGCVVIKSGSTNFPVISGQRTVDNLEIESNALLTVGSGGDLLSQGTLENSGTLTISANGRLTSEGTLVNNAGAGGFIVESDSTSGSGSVILNNNDVKATVRRHVSGKEWHIVSPPVSGQLISDFLKNTNSGISKNTSGDYAMTHYDESLYGTAGGWVSYYTDEITGYLIPGTGYLAGRSVSGILEFTGSLSAAAINGVEITRIANGWNTIGNPFASAIGVSDESTSENFLGVNSGQMDNSFGAIYIFDPKYEGGSYRIINNVPVGKPELNHNYLQPGQGFIVKSKEDGGTISFTKGMREHITEGTAPFFKKTSTEWSILKLYAACEHNIATTLIAFNGNMSRGLDPTYDAGQYGADPEFKLYTRLAEDDEGVNFAIQALPDYGFEDMVIPLGFDFAGGGEVTFSVAELNLPAGASAILEDRVLGVFTDLAEETYTVILNENSSGTGRFFIATHNHVTYADEISAIVSPKKLHIYAHNRVIYMVGKVDPESHADLYDMAGRKLKTVRLANPDRNSFRIYDLNTGIYLIRISGQDGTTTARVFID